MLMDEMLPGPEANWGVPYHWWCSELELKTTSEMYAQKFSLPVAYHRVPVTDENSPEAVDVEDFVEILQHCAEDDDPDGTAFVFNCQMGRGRTTTAMILAAMLLTGSEMEMPIEGSSERKALPRGAEAAVEYLCQVLDEELQGGPKSTQIRAYVDSIVDKCGAMQNLRDDIIAKHTRVADSRSKLQEASAEIFEDKYGNLHAMAAMVGKKWQKTESDSEMYCLYVERYLFLLLCGAYVGYVSIIEPDYDSALGFTTWLDIMPQLSLKYFNLIQKIHTSEEFLI